MEKLRQRSYEQIILFSKISVVLNVFMAAARLLIGVYSLSIFLCVNALYGAGMGLAKFVSLKGYYESNRPPDDKHPHGYGRLEYRYYYFVGLILFAASIAYMVYCIRMFAGHKSLAFSMHVGIAIAAFTFAELSLSIRGVIITRRNRQPIFEAIKLVNLASSLILLSLTQTAILSFTMPDEDMSFYNGLGGVIFSAWAALIGLYMVIRMQRIMTGKNKDFIEKKALKIMRKHISDLEIQIVGYEDNGPNAKYMYVYIAEPFSDEIYNLIKAKVESKLNITVVKTAL